jgi:hypothetical protein
VGAVHRELKNLIKERFGTRVKYMSVKDLLELVKEIENKLAQGKVEEELQGELTNDEQQLAKLIKSTKSTRSKK